MASTPPRVSVRLMGTDYTFETGRIARQASGAVLCTSGDNVVLATVVAAEEPRPGQGFLPLTVEYREKMAAVGRIPGNWNRREGRITDHEVLVSRLVDRTLRSLFPDQYRCEVQVQVQVLSAEPTSDVESLGLLAAAAAVHLSPVPARGPAGGLRVARVGDQLLPFPTTAQRTAADLEFAISTGPDGLVMLEGEAHEVPEAGCLAAIQQAGEWIGKFQKAFAELRDLKGGRQWQSPPAPVLPAVPDEVHAALGQALGIAVKATRRAAIRQAVAGWLAHLPEEQHTTAKAACDAAMCAAMREAVLAHGRRLDGRGLAEVRPIACEVGVLPRAHGSALFTRGETQALVSCTLGSDDEAQRLDSLSGTDQRQRFLLHYNFPPYSVNEARPLRGPGRREIGHGSLAARGLRAVLPSFQDWPYTLRIESEITESNGSSSMATACGATLAMLHAGVPLRRSVAGIAMGLITDGSRTAVLTDILGDEDHLGDMDFKVVGTDRGVTAIQLDNKVGGLPAAVLEQAFEQARRGRLQVLAAMNATLASANPQPSRFVPRAERVAIMPDSVGALIGARGANIKAITEQTGAKVSVDDSGQVMIYATDGERGRRAVLMVQRSAGVLRAGACYRGTVTTVKDFGVFVRINQVNEGLVPIEELGLEQGQRPGDVTREGDELVVSVLGADDRGRLRLSRKDALGVGDSQIEY